MQEEATRREANNQQRSHNGYHQVSAASNLANTYKKIGILEHKIKIDKTI